MTILSTWVKPDQQPALGDVDAHVWRVHLHEATTTDEAHLSADEKERAARFQVAAARQRFVMARSALRNLLGRYLEVDPAALVFTAGAHGKLALENDALAFNLSHAGDYALVAVTRYMPVGVDIEKVSSARASAGIAARFFSPREQAQLAAFSRESHADAFFRIWSRKEAVIKALGEGLACPLASFDVSADEGGARLLAFRREGVDVTGWSMLAINAAPGYAAALAVIGHFKCAHGFIYCRDE